MSEGGALVVWSTFPDEVSASAACRTLVEEGLVACAQRHTAPVVSTYRWEGALQEDHETLVVLKSDPARWDRLVRRLGELHPYETPQILAAPARGNAPYLEWLRANLDAGGKA